jgi:hypothetical protein
LGPMVKQQNLDAIVLIFESFDAENGINGVRLFLRAGLGDIRTAVAMPDVATLVVDTSIKKLAAQGRGIPFLMDRPGGQPWSYRLEENLDAATHTRVSSRMQSAIDAVVTQHLNTMGF